MYTDVRLVNKGVATEMAEIKRGKLKTKPLSDVKRKYGLLDKGAV